MSLCSELGTSFGGYATNKTSLDCRCCGRCRSLSGLSSSDRFIICEYTEHHKHLKIRKVMWWKIILGVIGLAVVGFIGMDIKMAITEAKEETRDIEGVSKSEN